MRVEAGPGVGQRGGLGGLRTPYVVLCAGGMRGTLLVLLTPQKWQLGFLVFLYLVAHNLPQLHMHAVIFSFFVFCCSRRRLSRCKHCSQGAWVQGPSLSPMGNAPLSPVQLSPSPTTYALPYGQEGREGQCCSCVEDHPSGCEELWA